MAKKKTMATKTDWFLIISRDLAAYGCFPKIGIPQKWMIWGEKPTIFGKHPYGNGLEKGRKIFHQLQGLKKKQSFR